MPSLPSEPDQAVGAAVDGTARYRAEFSTSIAGQAHSDWQEYHCVMVEERRLLVALTVTSGYGGGAG